MEEENANIFPEKQGEKELWLVYCHGRKTEPLLRVNVCTKYEEDSFYKLNSVLANVVQNLERLEKRRCQARSYRESGMARKEPK
jgi:hypothetical protein